ncbi:MAG: peptidase T [Candidatus Woesearchaeota archaeon]
MKETALDKLLRYVKIDTQSKDGEENTPSTTKQFNLANILVKELKEMGLESAFVDEHCYVYASLPSNIPQSDSAYNKVPAIGFVAHLDTSPDSSGSNVNPQVFTNYQGGDIVLPGNPEIIIKVSENPNLEKCIGQTIVTTDGTTLLGADDKAGISAIMTTIETLVSNPQILHGDIKIAFTPDEEIGQGTKFFDLSKFNAKYAYTVDGDFPGELNKETFSADSAIITAYGRDIHPGMAKNIMVNSIRAIADVIVRTPKDMAPETTEGYEPYIHPHSLEGSVSKSTLRFLLRDFNTDGLKEQKKILEEIIKEVQEIHPKVKLELEIIEMYRNMREELDKHPEVLENLWEAAIRAGVKPYWHPIRGGTDGSRLTAMGLPTPNIFTGTQNMHSLTEWISVDGLNKAVNTLIELVKVWYERSK